MISVDMYTLWGDDIEHIVQGIREATNNILSYRNNPNPSKSMLLNLGEDIGAICSFWTGNTYVGVPKQADVKEAFQVFFSELMALLLHMKESGKDFEVRVADAMLFRGTVYRYLGNNYPIDTKILPQYDNYYVSWSKAPENDYLLSKLYYPITFLTCEITAPFYGIDLDALGCSRGNEQEVVFPTIEGLITKTEYIDIEDDDDDQT